MLSALISAGANLLGNFLGSKNTDANNQTQLQIAAQNAAAQREFAQHGIRWKVADAEAAGLHPLAALGAQTSSFSPVSVGTEAFKPDFSALGQDLARAAKANASAESRAAVDEDRARKLALEKAGLENDILRSQLASSNISTNRVGGQLGPAMPSPDLPSGALAHLSRSPYRQSGIAVSEDEMKAKEVSGPGVKKMPLWGVLPLDTYPGRATGQDLENEYGEFGGGALAIPNTVVDAGWTAYNRGWLPIHRRLQRRYPRWFKD